MKRRWQRGEGECKEGEGELRKWREWRESVDGEGEGEGERKRRARVSVAHGLCEDAPESQIDFSEVLSVNCVHIWLSYKHGHVWILGINLPCVNVCRIENIIAHLQHNEVHTCSTRTN